MFKTFAVILLSVFLICKVANVESFWSAKKTIEKCDSENCENESSETELEKKMDEQQLFVHFALEEKIHFQIPSTAAFNYSVDYDNEIFQNLLSPPPELS